MTCSPRCWGASTRPSEPDVVHARAASNRCTTALRDLLGLVRRYWLPVGTSLNRCPRNQSAAKHAKRWPPITRRGSPSSSRTSPLRSTASAMVTSTYSTSTACCFSTPELPESYGSAATWATSRSPHATCSRRRRLIGGSAEPPRSDERSCVIPPLMTRCLSAGRPCPSVGLQRWSIDDTVL